MLFVVCCIHSCPFTKKSQVLLLLQIEPLNPPPLVGYFIIEHPTCFHVTVLALGGFDPAPPCAEVQVSVKVIPEHKSLVSVSLHRRRLQQFLKMLAEAPHTGGRVYDCTINFELQGPDLLIFELPVLTIYLESSLLLSTDQASFQLLKLNWTNTGDFLRIREPS
jgi:hypothetical protein